MHVLDIVDGVLARLLGREVDVDLDRLVVPAVDEEPAGEVDADLVEEVVEGNRVPEALPHLRPLAATREMDELVEEQLDPTRVVPQHPCDRLETRWRDRGGRLRVRAVQRPVVAALELVAEVGHVCRLVGGQPAHPRRADQHPVLFVPELGRAHEDRSVPLVGRKRRQDRVQPPFELALGRPRVEVDAEPLERPLDPSHHRRDRVTRLGGDLRDVGAVVAVLGWLLARANRVDRGAEPVHLGARVVVVVLALDVVAGELEEPRDAVAERAVPGRCDGDRARRVRGDHLDLDLLDRIVAKAPP